MPAATADHLGAEIVTQGETVAPPANIGRGANATAPSCEKCGGSLGFVAELPAIRLFPVIQVFKCAPCNDVVTMPAQV